VLVVAVNVPILMSLGIVSNEKQYWMDELHNRGSLCCRTKNTMGPERHCNAKALFDKNGICGDLIAVWDMKKTLL